MSVDIGIIGLAKSGKTENIAIIEGQVACPDSNDPAVIAASLLDYLVGKFDSFIKEIVVIFP